MKGLLRKDWYVLWKQGRVMMLFIVAYALIFSVTEYGQFLGVISMMLATSLVKLVMSYEEQGKWDSLAVALPLKRSQLVWEKYLLGIIAVTAGSLLVILGQALTGALAALSDGWKRTPVLGIGVQSPVFLLQNLILYFMTGLLLLAVEMPILFRFGVNKGRTWFMVLIAVVGGISGGLLGLLQEVRIDAFLHIGLWGIALVAVAVFLLSVRLSVRFYSGREF